MSISHIALRWRSTQLRWLLPAINLLGCALFVVLRPPVADIYLAEIDADRHRGGFVINSAVSGMIACRALYPWDEWHGGEALGVKILEVVNAPAASVVVGLELISLGGYWLPACQWSWILAAVFLTLSSTQWWLIGLAADAARRRWRGGRSRDVLRPAP